jgi:aminoglycoside 6'-N-acetyltransferase
MGPRTGTAAAAASHQVRMAIAVEPVRLEHAQRLRELRATPEVVRWWEPAPDGWPERTREPVEQLAVLVDGDVAGYVQFSEESDPDYRHADVDIFLGPGHQGRGIGPEALRVVVRDLVEERGHHRITLSTHPANDRAIRCYEKVGFRQVGVLRKAARSSVTGEWQDELLMELVV